MTFDAANPGGWTSSRLMASLALFTAPIYLMFLFPLTPFALASVTMLFGPKIWTDYTPKRSLVVGGVTATALVVAGLLVFFFGFGLCGPDSGSALLLAAGLAAATYATGCFMAAKNPWIWPLSLLAAAIAFVLVVHFALRSGVEVVC